MLMSKRNLKLNEMDSHAYELERLEEEFQAFCDSQNKHKRDLLRLVITTLTLGLKEHLDGEYLSALNHSQLLWNGDGSVSNVYEETKDRSRKELKRAVSRYGADSKEAWLARSIFVSLNETSDDDDGLKILIFELSTVYGISACRVRKCLSERFPGFAEFK